MKREKIRGTTVLAVRRDGKLAMGGDGQVTFANTILKGNAKKVRRMAEGKVLSGFAGSTADALTLFEKFESKLNEFNKNLTRSAIELAKEWRTNKMLKHLEALLVVGDLEKTLLISGTGDVVEPEHGIIGIGSGGHFAQTAAMALIKHTKLSAKEIVEESLKIAASICVYTNDSITIEEL